MQELKYMGCDCKHLDYIAHRHMNLHNNFTKLTSIVGPKLPFILQTTMWKEMALTALQPHNLMQYDLVIYQIINEKLSKRLNEDIPIETIEIVF